MANFIERPRYTCALGGAITTAQALPKTIPILHAPSGCAGNAAWTQAGGSGLQVGGYCGGLSMPGSNIEEKEVVFGGAERLKEQIKNTLEVMDGDLYIVLTGCVAEVIGDDVRSVVNPFREQGVNIIQAETGGFKGNSYVGYDLVLESLWRDFVVPAKIKKGRVNLWGIAPGFDVFWRGNLEALRRLLRKLGLEVNTFFTAEDSLTSIKEAASAELNIIVSDIFGLGAAELSKELYNIPYIKTGLPIGPSATDAFLRTVGSALELDKKVIETVIRAENRRYYQILEPLADCYNDADLQRYAAVVGDGNYAPAIAKFLADDIGWLPEVVAVTDILYEEQEQQILKGLNNFDSGLQPRTVFASDTSEIARIVKEHWAEQEEKNGSYSNPLTPAFVIGSSFERALAKDLGAAHLSVSFPVSNRAVLDRGYAGYSGGLRLLEDLISAIIPGR
jgi:nitrogenase molybdenum-iron protein beta chain